jgi:HAD superfamily hydrolase (TIGR01509 family)
VAIEAVIFDLDGTLVDTNTVHVAAWQRAFRRYGYDIPDEQVAEEVGKGGDHLVPALIGDAEDALHGDELRAAHGDEFLHLIALRPVRAFPGIHALFDAIQTRGLRIALATSARMEYLDATLESAHLNLKLLVQEIVTADDAASSKPAPDIVVAAVQKLGLDPSQCVMVGDTPHDAEACLRAGVAFIGLRGGGWSAEALRQAGASSVWADPVDLLQHLDAALASAGAAPPA